MLGKEIITIIYDGDCPVCNYYCKRIAIRDAGAELVLVDAREKHLLKSYETYIKGKDLNRGFVVMIGEEVFYSDKAMHALALAATSSGFFNRLNKWFFSSKGRARFWYPILVSLRLLLLKLMRRAPL